MADDRLRILEMIQNKVITAAEGADLLKALDVSSDNVVVQKKQAFKMLKIKVRTEDGDKVNVQFPIEFATIALKNSKGLMNIDAIQDFDLDVDMIIKMIESGALGKIVDITTADGDVIEIVIE